MGDATKVQKVPRGAHIRPLAVNTTNGRGVCTARYNEGTARANAGRPGVPNRNVLHMAGDAESDDARTHQDMASLPLVVCGLAPLAIFVWQYVITYTLLASPFGSMSAYYYGRCLLALPVAAAFLKMPTLRAKSGAALSLPMALVAGAAPIVLVLVPGNSIAACAACLAAGAASSWLYLRVFLMFAGMSVRDALTLLLGALSASYVCRMALGLASQAFLLVLGAVMPLACVLIVSRSIAYLARTRATIPARKGQSLVSSPAAEAASLYRLVIIEFAIYGLVAGLVRTPYETAQFEVMVNVGGGLLLLACNIALLWWARRQYADMHLRGICQAVLFLLLTVLLTLVLFGSADSAGAAITSLFARFGVYTLLLCVLCVLVSQLGCHPYATFGFGWGLFTLATGVGMSVATAVGISRFSATIALVIVYALFIVTSAAYARMRGDDRLFTIDAGTAELTDTSQTGSHNGEDPGRVDGVPAEERSANGSLTLDDIVRRCGELGELHGLTRRETEVVQLICLGRSKSHIANSLSVTENTVRGYAKNAYRKLGIHSRQDLLTLVGVE